MRPRLDAVRPRVPILLVRGAERTNWPGTKGPQKKRATGPANIDLGHGASQCGG